MNNQDNAKKISATQNIKEEKLSDILRSVKDMIEQPTQTYNLDGDDEYLEDDDILELRQLTNSNNNSNSEYELNNSQDTDDSSILSSKNKAQIKQDFAELAAQTKQNNAKDSFENRVDRIMKPLIQEWLNNHLPKIVKQIIAEEISKIRKN